MSASKEAICGSTEKDLEKPALDNLLKLRPQSNTMPFRRSSLNHRHRDGHVLVWNQRNLHESLEQQPQIVFSTISSLSFATTLRMRYIRGIILLFRPVFFPLDSFLVIYTCFSSSPDSCQRKQTRQLFNTRRWWKYFGTIISMPLSGLLAEYGFDGGWPSIFYVFGVVGTVWSIAFLIFVHEDPSSHPSIDEREKKYINDSLWGTDVVKSPPIPFKAIIKSLPFYAILFAHMGHNYGYETLMTELPTYMKQVLRFSLKSNGLLSSLPYLAMWLFSMFISVVADWMISSKRFSHTATRKLINSIGQYGPGVALIAASYTGCDRALTLAILTIGVGLNGGIYSGFKINHLDLTPRFAGFLMSITNCSANLAGLLAPIAAGHLISDPSKPMMGQWQIVFFIAAFVYIICGTFYNIFGSGERQYWDNPEDDEQKPALQTTVTTSPARLSNGSTAPAAISSS
ncbi:GD25524 [Drosophila simulans]|uniref:GD25524 n=1 Tax=Drosophila simulans TaxID=7240 RepID=B4QIE3_DROSI|nr:GD25524 [Drosophila simulans]